MTKTEARFTLLESQQQDQNFSINTKGHNTELERQLKEGVMLLKEGRRS